ncbi:hypothetical protein N8Y61_01015 [Akkermansiaceae bacterium]|nr:hypothetical protein [Akkermansiaceae bacterium]
MTPLAKIPINLCCSIIFIFLSVGCEDGSANAEKAAAEKAAAEKTAAEKAAAEKAAKDQIVSDVITFLNGEDWVVMDRESDEENNNNIAITKTKDFVKFIYDDFVYDKETKTLTFKSLECKSNDTRLVSSHPTTYLGFDRSTLSLKKFYLETAESVIKIKDFPSWYGVDSDKIKGVEISGRYGLKTKDKEEKWNNEDMKSPLLGSVRTTPTTEDWEAMETKDFENVEGQSLTFWVKEDLAPRLKSALEDLTKAHGVKPSKY